MRCEFVSEGTVLTLTLEGELDHHSVGEVREKTDVMLKCGVYHKLVIDLRGLTFMDSSGISLVMGRVNLLAPLNGKVEIISDKPRITKILKLADVDKYAAVREA